MVCRRRPYFLLASRSILSRSCDRNKSGVGEIGLIEDDENEGCPIRRGGGVNMIWESCGHFSTQGLWNSIPDIFGVICQVYSKLCMKLCKVLSVHFNLVAGVFFMSAAKWALVVIMSGLTGFHQVWWYIVIPHCSVLILFFSVVPQE